MSIVSKLSAATGLACIVDPDILRVHAADWTGQFHGHPRGLVRPTTLEQVRRLVLSAGDLDVPLAVQGGNTSLSGGTVPSEGSIIVMTRGLLGGVNVESGLALADVGAGYTLAEVTEATASYGLVPGVDLASRQSATIGGMCATNAGGTRVIRYGPMRSQVVGVEAVTGSGEVISEMRAILKDNSGLSFASLLTGSEGTLAVITRVQMRLHRVERDCTVAVVSFDSASSLVNAAVQVRSAVAPLALEFFTGEGASVVAQALGRRSPFDLSAWAMLVEVAVGEEDALAASLIELRGVGESFIAHQGSAAYRGLWEWREMHAVALASTGVVQKLDVAIPLVHLADLIRSTSEIAVAMGGRVVPFGHLGDGNVHLNVVWSDADLAVEAIVAESVYRWVAMRGGSVSAEHGIGTLKRPYLGLVRTPEQLKLMREIKAVFDPKGILNPGVLL